MALVIIDDPFTTPSPGVPGGAGAGSFETASAPPYVYIFDDIDAAGDWGWTSAPLVGTSPPVIVTPPTISYDDNGGFVRICADGFLDGVDCAIIERSTDQAHWTAIRGGACAAFPVGGLVLPGTPGSYASTPDDASLDIVGDLDLRAELIVNDLNGVKVVISKFNAVGNQQSYILQINGGLLQFVWSNNGAAVLEGNSGPNLISPTGRQAIRATLDVDNGAAGRTITFYTAPTIAGPWTQLGSPVIQAGTTNIFASTSPVEVGSQGGGTLGVFATTVQAVEIRDGINGTLVAQPVFWNDAPTGSTFFTDRVGKTWTINGAAFIQHREVCLNDYEFIPCVTNYYRVRVDPPGLYGLGAGGWADTPDNAVLDITGDIDIRADVSLTDWIAPFAQDLVAKWNDATQNAYLFRMEANGFIGLVWSTTGADFPGAQSTVPVTAVDGSRLAVRATMDVNNGAGGRTIVFYTAPTIAGPWTQLGSPVVQAGVTSIFSSSQFVEVGARNGGGEPMWGIMHAAQILNGINGTLVANPDFTAQTWGAPSFTDSVGRVWTIVGNAIIATTQLYVPSITPALTKIWLKSINRPFLNLAFPIDCFSDATTHPMELLSPPSGVSRAARAGIFPIVNRTYAVAVNDLRLGRQWAVGIRTLTTAALRAVDFLLASGDVIFIQVPSGCVDCADTIEAGYVSALTAGYQRHFQFRNQAIWTVDVVEVAVPGPDIVYAEATWQTVINQYGSWAAVVAANPTWAAVLALLPNPSEVIVA